MPMSSNTTKWRKSPPFCHDSVGFLFLDEYACIDSHHVLVVSQQRIDVYLLDFRGKAQESAQPHDNLGIALFVQSLLSACTFYNFIATQRMNHGVGLAIG